MKPTIDQLPGLAALRHDRVAKSAGLSEKWIQRLLANPLAKNAGVAQWRQHFLTLKHQHENPPSEVKE